MLVEGAGSAAEVNLRAGDIANMGFAEAADVPVVLVGDIDRGGVIASIIGTHLLLSEAERRARGYVVNKFRGDTACSTTARAMIGERNRAGRFGIVPFFDGRARLPPRTRSMSRRRRPPSGRRIKIAVPVLARIANFDDLDPLAPSPTSRSYFVQPGEALPGDADLVILPGSKATLADLAFVRDQGWDMDIAAHVRRGGAVLGICGGYQMLGRSCWPTRTGSKARRAAEGARPARCRDRDHRRQDAGRGGGRRDGERRGRFPATKCMWATPAPALSRTGSSDAQPGAGQRPTAPTRRTGGSWGVTCTACSPATASATRSWPAARSDPARRAWRWPMRRGRKIRSMRWLIISKTVWISINRWPAPMSRAGAAGHYSASSSRAATAGRLTTLAKGTAPVRRISPTCVRRRRRPSRHRRRSCRRTSAARQARPSAPAIAASGQPALGDRCRGHRAPWCARHRRRVCRPIADQRHEDPAIRAGIGVDGIVQPCGELAEMFVVDVAIADHAVEGVDCLVGEQPRQAEHQNQNSGATTPSEKFSAADLIAARATPCFVEAVRIAADDMGDGGTSFGERDIKFVGDRADVIEQAAIGDQPLASPSAKTQP